MKIHAIKTLIFIIQWAKFIQDFISSEPESGMATLEKSSRSYLLAQSLPLKQGIILH